MNWSTRQFQSKAEAEVGGASESPVFEQGENKPQFRFILLNPTNRNLRTREVGTSYLTYLSDTLGAPPPTAPSPAIGMAAKHGLTVTTALQFRNLIARKAVSFRFVEARLR